MSNLIDLLNERILDKTHEVITDADRHRIEGLALAREIIAPHLECKTVVLQKPRLVINGHPVTISIEDVEIEYDYLDGQTVRITTSDAETGLWRY